MRRVALIKFSLIFILLFSITSLADGDYSKHEANLYQFMGKINANEAAVKSLIKEKNETTDAAKSKEILEEIKKNLKERKETIRKYNKEYNHVLYEHPGQMNYPEDQKEEKKEGGHEKPKEHSGEHEGSGVERHAIRYKRYDEKTIQEFEDETNKLISNIYQDVQKKYNSK